MRRTRRSRWSNAALATLVALAGSGVAHAAGVHAPPIDPCATPTNSNYLVADATHTGTIDLVFYNASYARVVFFECVGDRLKRLGAKRADPANPATMFQAAATWSCDRVVRRFAGVAVLPDGTIAFGSYSVRTPSCANRFAIRAPSHVKADGVAHVSVVDRWGIGGIHPDLCAKSPAVRESCTTLSFPGAITSASARVKAAARGPLQLTLRVLGDHSRTTVAVGDESVKAPAKLPTVLAAGDSTMQGVDSFLADELTDFANVVSDSRPGTGITRGDYWQYHAISQTNRLRQRATVMSVGAASDGLSLPTPIGVVAVCCGAPWIQAYAARVRGIMQTFLRGGRGRVVWMTPPEPRYAPRAQITHAINVAIELAAKRLSGVKVLRIDKMFAPSGAYQDDIVYQGRDVLVRESDGVHLNVTGTAIAAKAVAAAIKAIH